MYLMRLGAGAEKPVARIDDESYVDLCDIVADFDEAFFGGEGLDQDDRLGPLPSRALSEPFPCLGAGRSDQKRHATRGGHGLPSAGLAAAGDVMELGIEGLGSQRQNVLGPR